MIHILFQSDYAGKESILSVKQRQFFDRTYDGEGRSDAQVPLLGVRHTRQSQGSSPVAKIKLADF